MTARKRIKVYSVPKLGNSGGRVERPRLATESCALRLGVKVADELFRGQAYGCHLDHVAYVQDVSGSAITIEK